MSERVISRIGVVTALAAAVAAVGCGIAGAQESPPTPTRTLVPRCTTAPSFASAPPTSPGLRSSKRPVTAFRVPGHGSIARFSLLNANGVPNVLGVLGERVDARCRVTWLHVALPLRPNGVTGWVLAKNLQRASVHTRITVDLSERRVRLYRKGKLVSQLARGDRLERDADAALGGTTSISASSRATRPARLGRARSASRRSRRC